jgi:acyl carrier protein
MQIDRDRILDILYRSVEDWNEQFGQGIQLEKTSETLLLGPGAPLDSLAFVNLVAIIEEKCEDELGTGLSLTDQSSAASGEDTSQSIGSLADHLIRLLKEKQR